MKHHHYCCLMASERANIYWKALLVDEWRASYRLGDLSSLGISFHRTFLVCIRSIIVVLRQQAIVIRFVNLPKLRFPLLRIVIFCSLRTFAFRDWNCFRNEFTFESSLIRKPKEKKFLRSNFPCFLHLFTYLSLMCALMYGFCFHCDHRFLFVLCIFVCNGNERLSNKIGKNTPARNVIQIILSLKKSSKAKLFFSSLMAKIQITEALRAKTTIGFGQSVIFPFVSKMALIPWCFKLKRAVITQRLI